MEVHAAVVRELEGRGHEVTLFGSFESGEEVEWAPATAAAARSVVEGRCDEAVLLCWSGTGASIAANKLPGIRAALCWDAETAKLARVWNHANAICLPNRCLDEALVVEILSAWFDTPEGEKGSAGVALLDEVDAANRGEG